MDAAAHHSTAHLISLYQAGDQRAREDLFARCLPLLRQWAHGRLPGYARELADTNDLVQVTLIRALNRLDEFGSRGQGSFLAYLRTILLNTVRDEIRRTGRVAPCQTLHDERCVDQAPSQVEQLVGAEEMARYESALADLPQAQQDVLILRIEFGLSFPEIALETGRKADAARMLFRRGYARLAEVLDHGKPV